MISLQSKWQSGASTGRSGPTRPVATAVAERGVYSQRVVPDVGDVSFGEGVRNATRERRARDGQVPQAALGEELTSLRRVSGCTTGMLLVELEQRVLELRQLEEQLSP